MAARSIVRRTHPDAYADILRRWPDTKPSPARSAGEKPASSKKRADAPKTKGLPPAEAFEQGQKILKERS
jgi:hypothetical protein